jgi:hypothetical protein
MTFTQAHGNLTAAVEDLWRAVGELALTVFEDRPAGCELAVVDDLAERVSELQGDIAAARILLRDNAAVTTLPTVARHLDAAHRRYWRDTRSYRMALALRRGIRGGNRELHGWRNSVDVGLERCEEPFAATYAVLNTCWQEVCNRSMPGRPS